MKTNEKKNATIKDFFYPCDNNPETLTQNALWLNSEISHEHAGH